MLENRATGFCMWNPFDGDIFCHFGIHALFDLNYYVTLDDDSLVKCHGWSQQFLFRIEDVSSSEPPSQGTCLPEKTNKKCQGQGIEYALGNMKKGECRLACQNQAQNGCCSFRTDTQACTFIENGQ